MKNENTKVANVRNMKGETVSDRVVQIFGWSYVKIAGEWFRAAPIRDTIARTYGESFQVDRKIGSRKLIAAIEAAA